MSFDEWQQHYASYDHPSLVAEASTFKEIIPFNRMAAFLVRLMDVACDDASLPYEERLKAATMAVTTAHILLPTPGFEAAFRATLEKLQKFSIYPAIASAVEEGTFDQQNVVGLILTKLEPHEVDLLKRLVERGGSGTISGNQDHRKFDRLEKGGYIERQAVAMDAVEYVATQRGRDAVAE
jgi:hypothetical protein